MLLINIAMFFEQHSLNCGVIKRLNQRSKWQICRSWKKFKPLHRI